MVDGKALLLQAKISRNDLDIFENKLLDLCQQYFLDPLKSDLLILNRTGFVGDFLFKLGYLT